ncbi:reverse transcriptase domain-containing protein [Herpetosiphon sp. NSE202]|uniref:reverse transcriptase domain-containing protein n=1 Tax=Herpetosiphon sp. NSE202 TaxID=3351349 RepID=UPI00362F8C09
MSIEDLSTEELADRFRGLIYRYDLAQLLDIEEKTLNFYLYKASNNYIRFEIPKKSGGFREIFAPNPPLKVIQQKVSTILSSIYPSVYKNHPPAHGFIKNRSIVTNAKLHIRKRYILNIDIKDFFPTITFSRVRGLLMAWPYQCTADIATAIAQLCCFQGKLPQGAPTSPIISNMICSRLDSDLRNLAKKNRCYYSRYADDITFSTNVKNFPSSIAMISEETQKLQISEELLEIITKNYFTINPDKSRLQTNIQRQEVTGLVVNEKVNVTRRYIRQIRAMLHAWKKFGYDLAQEEYYNKYMSEYNSSKENKALFKNILRGKIEFLGMVRGKSDHLYQNFYRQLGSIDNTLISESLLRSFDTKYRVILCTEGKTDIMHLKNALYKLRNEGYYQNIEIQFDENNSDKGSPGLVTFCEQNSRIKHDIPIICMFDRDEPDILKKITGQNRDIKHWDNSNVFSFAIPVPINRLDEDNNSISIEFYYSDTEIKTLSNEGRRLYINNEFNIKTKRHNIDRELNTTFQKKGSQGVIYIIDSHVYNSNEDNVALSKNDFASNILNQKEGFDNFSIHNFKLIFDIIQDIARESKNQ